MAKVGFTHESQDAVTIDWYTPPYIFEQLDLKFDMDVCGPVGGVKWIPAERTLSLEDDGLATKWNGLVWCNPPYGRETSAWMKKMNEYRNGIALVFARTDCKWFHDYCAKADGILFLKGRVKFVDAFANTGGNGAGAESMLVAWGEQGLQALRRMEEQSLGKLMIC